MVEFNEAYFKPEYREGFYIEEKMKRAWAAQIEVLEEIRRICMKHGITFFADWGSLLGAVRHKGFIPWDDDLDIGMLRGDYMRFLEVAPSELCHPFEIKSLYNDPEHDNVKCRVISGRHMNFDRKYLDMFHNCPYVVGIDIFPIDYIPKDASKMNEQTKMIELVMSVAASVPPEPPYSDEVLELAAKLERTFGVSFDKNNRLFHELKKLVDMLSALYDESCSKEVCSMIDLAGGWDYHVPVSCYSKSMELPFENVTIPVPIGYDTILRIKYGDDYMTPRQCSSSHDYPFYAKQEQALKDVLEREYGREFTDDEFQKLLAEEIKG